MTEDTLTITGSLLLSASAVDFAGADPFDGLNSKFFDYFPALKKGLFGLAWIQLNKRSVINLRPLLAVPKKRNPKGVALFILGLLQDYQRTSEKHYLASAIDLADWLLQQRCNLDRWKHSCWGYHFDWNARAFYVEKDKPNVISTIYVAQALYALGKVTKQEKYLPPAIDAATFIVETLYCEFEDRCFFAYIPGETAFVHNASLWGAAWVGFVASVTGNKEYQALAVKVAMQSVKEQGSDGEWVYGSRSHHQFIDGFHTGYNLEALQLLKESLQVTTFDESIKRGVTYYKNTFFEEDGTAKYYHNNCFPLDMHSVSQAVFTLLRVGKTDDDLLLAKKVINQSINRLYLPEKKQFLYQKTKFSNNRINYIRWTEAWVYYSFAFYNNYNQGVANNAKN
ncbi:MAG: aspartate-semialdehyde dehydrogenase [Alteromonadales bacterium]|nr:aspartate-semialdehyde dehydrogenase [Alteromonadales bacterium]